MSPSELKRHPHQPMGACVVTTPWLNHTELCLTQSSVTTSTHLHLSLDFSLVIKLDTGLWYRAALGAGDGDNSWHGDLNICELRPAVSTVSVLWLGQAGQYSSTSPHTHHHQYQHWTGNIVSASVWQQDRGDIKVVSHSVFGINNLLLLYSDRLYKLNMKDHIWQHACWTKNRLVKICPLFWSL